MCTQIDTNFLHCVPEMPQFAIYIYTYMCRVLLLILTMKYAVCGAIVYWIICTQHGTLPSFLEFDKTVGSYSLKIYYYLSRIQRETKAFLLVVVVVVVVVVIVVVVGQIVGSISSRTLAYDCFCTLELCTASMIATS